LAGIKNILRVRLLRVQHAVAAIKAVICDLEAEVKVVSVPVLRLVSCANIREQSAIAAPAYSLFLLAVDGRGLAASLLASYSMNVRAPKPSF
jgi:hypothetical protein